MAHWTTEQRMTRAGQWPIAVVLSLATGACATSRPSVTRPIFDAGPNYVKLVELRNPEGDPALRFDHPVDFHAKDFYPLLDTFTAAHKTFKDYGPAEPVFPRAARALLASHLAEAFNQATDTEYVAFKFTLRVPAFLLPKYEVTAGTMFVRDNEFHLQLEYFAADSADVERITYRPERRTLEGAARLVVGEHMRYETPAAGGRPYVHWVAADWPTLQQKLTTYRRARARRDAARDRDTRQKRRDAEWESFEDVPVIIKQGEFLNPDAAPGEASVHTRLERLRDLRERGLITEEEYAATRQQILDGL